MIKSKYTKPTVRLFHGGLGSSICSNIISTSICIKVYDDTGGTTRIDHRSVQEAGSIKWEDWPNN